VVQNRLDHEVAKLIIYQHLDTLRGNSDQVLFPLACCRRYALFNDLTPMLVACHLREVLDDWLIDDGPTLVRFEEHQALSKHVVTTDI